MSTDDLAGEVGELLDRLPRIKITPETIRQTTIDQWYQREERYRAEIGQLRDELAEAQADLAVVQGFTNGLIDTIRTLAVAPAGGQQAALDYLAANLVTYIVPSTRAPVDEKPGGSTADALNALGFAGLTNWRDVSSANTVREA